MSLEYIPRWRAIPVPDPKGHHQVEGSSSPLRNKLLAHLPERSYRSLLPHLELAEFAPGSYLHEPGQASRHLCFPLAGVVSRVAETSDGRSTELSVVGNDGLIGVSRLLGGRVISSRAVVLLATRAACLAAPVALRLFDSDSAVRDLFLRYAQGLILQTVQTALCNKHHTLEQQLCRWLLMCLDRHPGGQLGITHDLISRMLGVRRAGVTETMGRLQQAGCIRYDRAAVQVVERRGLEARACECYETLNANYAALMFGAKLSARRLEDV